MRVEGSGLRSEHAEQARAKPEASALKSRAMRKALEAMRRLEQEVVPEAIPGDPRGRRLDIRA